MSQKEITKQKSVGRSKTPTKDADPAAEPSLNPPQLSQALAAVETAVADLKAMSQQSDSPEYRHHHDQKPAGDNSAVSALESGPRIPPPEPPPPTPSQILAAISLAITDTEAVVSDIQTKLQIDTNLTGRERARLIGVKARNYGFINKAYDIAHDNPVFATPNFNLTGMAKTLDILEQSRQLTMVTEQLQRLAEDVLMTTCTTAYRDALRIYGNLREQSRGKVAGADALFQQLRQYFSLRRRNGETEPPPPTEHELELDFKRVMQGKADGQMTIKHESPHLTGGVHEVVDEVRPRRRGRKAEIKVESAE